MTLDQAVDAAFRIRAGEPLEVDTEDLRDVLQMEVDRLVDLPTWEARFARSILEPMADELYKPQLGNAAIA